ncbi:MAG: hotdog fold thioesterase [Brachybacterium sp.]|nr:hotdog fold thioesterase [Brachybacterium sp.]
MSTGVDLPLPPEDLASMLRGTLVERTGTRIERFDASGGSATMPVVGNTQPAGLLHGGATIALAETIASFAAIVRAREVHGDGAQAVGTHVAATHHRAGRSGLVRATCTLRHGGRQVASYLVEVHDDQERLLSTVLVDTMLLPPRGEGA